MAANNPVVVTAAGRGEQWALKLRDKGWKYLTKTQKATARSHGIGAVPPSMVIPRTTRVIRGNPTNSRRPPGAPGNADKTTAITKQEYLGEMFADGEIRSFVIDPRNVGTFPHISAFALGYNKYRLTSCQVRYSNKVLDSECGVTIAYSSDSGDEPPKGKFDLYSMGTKFESAAHKSMVCTLPVNKGVRYLRDCPDENAKEVDNGVFHVLLDGKHDGRLGELFIHVSIVFSEPTYNQKSTQLITGHKVVGGPNFCEPVKSANTVSLRFLAAGNFLLSTHTSLLERVGQLEMDTAGHTQVDSETHSSNIIEVRTNKPGSTIVLYFKSADHMSLRAYVSRL